MFHEVTATNLRHQLGELLNEVQYRGDVVLITRAGKPVAAMVDMALYEHIRHMKEELDRLRGDLVALPTDATEATVD